MKDKFEFNSIWIYISLFIYLLIRIIEYVLGQKGQPEWVIDFFPYILPLCFLIMFLKNVDYILGDSKKESEKN